MQHCLAEGHVVAHLHMTEMDSLDHAHHHHHIGVSHTATTTRADRTVASMAETQRQVTRRHHQQNAANTCNGRTSSIVRLLEVSNNSKTDSILEDTQSSRCDGGSVHARAAGGSRGFKETSTDAVQLNGTNAFPHCERGKNSDVKLFEEEGREKQGREESDLRPRKRPDGHCDLQEASQRSRRSLNSADYLDVGDIVFHSGDTHRTKWEEAAIFVKEGEDNEKFNHHPQGRWSKIAFKILHHPAYYVTHLIVTILLILLALVENHPVEGYPLPRARGEEISDHTNFTVLMVDAVLELMFLSFLAVYIILKLIWFGPRQFITSKTTVFNTVVLIVMFVEAVVVLVRQESHVRVTRALRPVFFIDNVLMDGVRRELRDILKSLKPIVDVLMLLLFMIFMFALLGYYILAEVDPSYFDSVKKSFISLFILMTTANNPDIMLESYYEQPASVVYFVLYLIVTLYFITNVLLAVVYSSFSDAEMLKFKELYLHKRQALCLAFNTLTSPEGIIFHDFLLFLQHYRPRLTEFDAMCMFKALHRDSSCEGEHQAMAISREEFYSFYEVQGMRWKQIRDDHKVPWYEELHVKSCRSLVKVCHNLVKSKTFNAIVNFIVLINVIAFAIYALVVDDCPPEQRFNKLRQIYPLSMIFTLAYCGEIVLKIVGYGPHNYYRKPWNVIDTLLVFVSIICLFLEVDSRLAFLALVRPLKLLRLLRLKRKYRDIMSTIVYLTPKMLTVAIFVVIVHYFFAIIGIEFLSGRVYKGCCNDSWFSVGSYFRGNIFENTTDNIDPAASDVFYILNYDDLCSSYVTLFALMVVNNWFIIMEGFSSQVQHDWLARIYFLSFNITTLVIFEVVISFIVEAFVFKILARQRSRICPTHQKHYHHCNCVNSSDRKKKVKINIEKADIDEIKLEHDLNNTHKTIFNIGLNHIRFWKDDNSNETTKTYVGRRLKTKDDIQLQMYRPLLDEWIEAENAREEVDSSNKVKQPLRTTLLKYISNCYEYITD